VAYVLTTSACSAGREGGDTQRRDTVARPLDIYRDLGFLTGTGQFPAVASFATMAGPADSTYVLFGLSIPNNALRFQRDATGFYAEYDVNIVFARPDSGVAHRLVTREQVRIPSFAETSRTDESIVFQQVFPLTPGRYVVQVQAADAHSSRGFRMVDTVTAPAYGVRDSRISTPVLAYRADPRRERGQRPSLIVNPRHTVAFGGTSPLLYVEAYGAHESVTAEVMDATGRVVWQQAVPMQRSDDMLHSGVVTIPSEEFALGRFTITVRSGVTGSEPRPLLLTISDQWMVANFEEVLQIVRLIAHPAELDSLRSGTPSERRAQWELFWQRRNPLPAAGINEYREQFFQRVRFATEAFREAGGRAGWQTDRGEVYIVLGPPDHAFERFIGRTDVTGQPNAVEWMYSNAGGSRLNLLFHDRTGFGRLELVPASASAFRAAAERVKPRLPRN
jgi:GWxTD domain-containing protein